VTEVVYHLLVSCDVDLPFLLIEVWQDIGNELLRLLQAFPERASHLVLGEMAGLLVGNVGEDYGVSQGMTQPRQRET
jgi:hypothetical protein